MNERFQNSYAVTRSGITSFPVAYQIDARETADSVIYSPGLITEGAALASQNVEMWIVEGIYGSQGWLDPLIVAKVIRQEPQFVQGAGLSASIPWNGSLKLAVVFQQFAGAAMVNGRLSFTVVPLNNTIRRINNV